MAGYRDEPSFSNPRRAPSMHSGVNHIVDIDKPDGQIIDMNYKLDRELAELSYEDFMNILIEELKVGRKECFVRLFLYPVNADFINAGKSYFAIFIRKRDLYVLGIYGRDGIVYELGKPKKGPRYFTRSQVTGFGEETGGEVTGGEVTGRAVTGFAKEYKELFEGTDGNLCGVWIGFHVLNEAVMRIIVKWDDPFSWAWSVGIFAIMFSECARFVWFQDKLKHVMAHGGKDNIRMWKRNRFMCMLKNRWGAISECARNGPVYYDPRCFQPEGEKYEVLGVENLTLDKNYASDSLSIRTWDYSYGADNGPTIETRRSDGARGYGDGGGCYGGDGAGESDGDDGGGSDGGGGMRIQFGTFGEVVVPARYD